MAYIDPKSVVSPKHSWGKDFEVLADTGNGGWSVAEGTWEGSACLGLRWNGSNEEPSIGNPQSRGNPTWFIVPDELVDDIKYKIKILNESKALVSSHITKPERYDKRARLITLQLHEKVIEKIAQIGNNWELGLHMPDASKVHWFTDREFRRADGESLYCAFINGKCKIEVVVKNPESDEEEINRAIREFEDILKQNTASRIAQSGIMDLP